MNPHEVDVCVVGGGISGLTLGYLLKKSGHQVSVLEAEEHVGGNIRTIQKDGFLLELGPNTVMLKPEMKKLLDELGLSAIFPSGDPRKRFVVKGPAEAPQLVPFPLGLSSAITSPILSFPGKLRLFREPFISAISSEDESVEGFFTRRFGTELTSEIVSPALSGIWAADISKLSTRTSLPTLWDAERESGSVLRHFLKRKKTKKEKPRIISFADGLGSIPGKLEAALGDSLWKRARVDALERGHNQTRIVTTGGTFVARRVVLALPAFACAKILQDAQMQSALSQVPHSSIGVLHVALRTSSLKNIPEGFGFLWKPRAGKALMGAIFSSALFPHAAPKDFVLLTCFAGGAMNPDLFDVTQPEIQSQVIRELQSVLGFTEAPKILHARGWRKAIPNPAPGHFRLVELARAYESSHPEIRFLSGWLGATSIPDRIGAAYTLAEELDRSMELRHADANALKYQNNLGG